MGPINYLGPQEDFLQSIQGGLQLGSGIRQMRDQRVKAEQAQLAQQQYQTDIQAATKNPTPQAFAALTLKYPQHREAYKDAWGTLNAAQQQSELSDAAELGAALQAGRPDVAESKLTERIEVLKASGLPTQQAEFLLDSVRTDPKSAYAKLLHVVSGLPGGDKLLENLGKIGTEQRAAAGEQRAAAEAPAKLEKLQAEAKTAGVTAEFARSQALLDIEKKGWDIKAIEADNEYKKQSTRIAAMNAAISREGNDLKRQELKLKIDDAVRARDDKVREKVATAEAGANSIDNMLNTIQRIKKNPSLDDVIGSYEGRISPIVGSALDDEESDAIGLIETLGSQAFLAQIPSIKGMGALSNAEGDKLQNALQNLSRAQSEKQFRANLEEAARLLTKGRESLSKSTGVPLGKPDTPAAPGARPPLSSFER